MWALSTCGEPDEIKKNTHPKNITALLASRQCGCKIAGGGCCFGSVIGAISDVVVENNHVTVAKGSGETCKRNGVRVFAAHSVNRGNVCEEV